MRRAALLALLVSFPRAALADTEPPPEPAKAVTPEPNAVETPVGKLTAGGYAEVAYSFNLNRPQNRITNYRGFDNRHDTFTLSNIAFEGQWEQGDASARVILQFGHTPNTYYLGEPTLPGSAATPASDASTWKYLQQAHVGYKLGLGRGLLLQAGLFASPIGVEAFAVKDNWNWSRSNLFFGLPFYHAGVRATQQLADKWTAIFAIYNGWNSVTDPRAGKSFAAQLQYADPDRLLASLVYFGGPERPHAAPEGRPWRHAFDAWVQLKVIDPLWVAAHADAGFEVTRFGTASWTAGALYARGRVLPWLYLAGRGDAFREKLASSANGTSAPIFFPSDWVASLTGTVELKPRENFSVRLEYRHDAAQGPIYFGRFVEGDGSSAAPYVPNARTQDTLTLGATAWL